MNLSSKQYSVEDNAQAQEFYHSRGWTDGFPVVPPTSDAVVACLEWANLTAGELIGIEPVRERAITAERLGVPAVGVMTSKFVSAADFMARVLGMPDVEYSTIEHPVSSATDNELLQKAQTALADIERIVIASGA